MNTAALSTLLGIWIWGALLNRNLLSIPRDVFKLVERGQGATLTWWRNARREVCTHLVRACLAPRGARRSTALARSTAFGAHELGCCKKSAARVRGFRRQGYG